MKFERVDLAVPVAVSADSAPSKSDPAPPEIFKANFETFKLRKQGKKAIGMPPSERKTLFARSDGR